MITPKITISLPCYKRPQRTMRAIESIMSQTEQGFELLITTDGDEELCIKILQRFDFYTDHISRYGTYVYTNPVKNQRISINNAIEHTGCWGYDIRNKHIQDACGKYFMFMGSDDILEPTHLENILGRIDRTVYNWMYFDTWVEPNNAPRNAQLKNGMIGHSELIVRSEFLRLMPPHTKFYGHDWTLVENLMSNTMVYLKAAGLPQTYKVMSIPGREEQGID